MFSETIFCLFHSLFEAARQQMVRKPKLKIKHTRCKDAHLNAEDCLFGKKNWKLKNERMISCFHNDRKGFKQFFLMYQMQY